MTFAVRFWRGLLNLLTGGERSGDWVELGNSLTRSILTDPVPQLALPAAEYVIGEDDYSSEWAPAEAVAVVEEVAEAGEKDEAAA